MRPKFKNNPPAGSRRKANAQRSESAARTEWLASHEGSRPPRLAPDPKAALSEIGDMPRAMLEREIAEWMLADKQALEGEDFGAQPRELPFAQFSEWRAPIVNDGGPMRARTEAQERDTAAHIAGEAAKCAELFRAVIIQISLDRYAGAGGAAWGTPKDDRRWARMFMSDPGKHWAACREHLCAMAMIDAGALQLADAKGRLKELSADAIGKKRYATRLLNAEATAKQPDLFRSLGL